MDAPLPPTDPSTKINPLPPRKRHQSYSPTDSDNTDDVTVQSMPPRKRHELYTQKEELKRKLMPPPPPRKPRPSSTPKDSDISQQHQLLPPRQRHRSYAPEDDNTDVSLQSTPPSNRHRSYITPKHGNKDIIKFQSTPPSKRRLLFRSKDDNDNITFQSTPLNYYDTVSRTVSTWRKFYEINLLKGFVEYYIENGTYPTDTTIDMQKFNKSWIERRGDYLDEQVFSNKVVELSERFLMNQRRIFSGQNVQGWPDRFDVQIYRLSYLIWGKEVNDQKDSSSKSIESKDYCMFL